MIDRSRRDWKPFKIGQEVLLETRNLKLPYRSKKIAPKRLGPFRITAQVGTRAYRLKLPPGWRIHNVFHASLLTPFKTTDSHGPPYTTPPPDLIAGEEEYEIDYIVNHQKRGRNTQFLVHWKGYPDAKNSWLWERELKNAPDILRDYREKNL